jgi:phenylalanyl-tRNA synthetase alpha chain
MSNSYLSRSELRAALAIRDLTDPAEGPHAMQLLLDAIHAALPAPVHVHRASPIVSVADNYDRLGYPAGGAARDRRYTRYVCESALLRTQTSAMIPPLLAKDLPADVVLSCPGLVYRRDVIDRLHVGEPHQVDLWRIAQRVLTTDDLGAMIACVVGAALPGVRWRTIAATHPVNSIGTTRNQPINPTSRCSAILRVAIRVAWSKSWSIHAVNRAPWMWNSHGKDGIGKRLFR